MCARFLLNVPARLIAEVFHADRVDLSPQALKGPRHTDAPRLNIRPTEDIPIVRDRPADAGEPAHRELALASWGLVPHWAEDSNAASRIAARTINARAETAPTKPAFRDAFERRRCVIPASGFYEWKKPVADRGKKRPVMIRRRDGRLLAIAGLYESWKPRDNPDAPRVRTCTILTCDPNSLIAPIHNRMPALLAPEAIDAWLDPGGHDTRALRSLLKPAPEADLELAEINYSLNDHGRAGPEEPTLFG
jgi:putative SOS response-associated peptidase YedK